jgi:Family of unknown function (DUF6261)
MFTKAKIKLYHIGELVAFFKALSQICTDAGAAALNIDVASATNLAAAKQVEAAFAYQKDSPLTIEIENLDIARDHCVVGIKLVADGFSHHFDVTLKAAANTILTCYNKYGSGIDRLNYNAETEVVDKLVNDFKTDATVVNALAKLNCTTWVDELKTQNDSFKTKYLARNAQFANHPSQSAGELKPLAVTAYEALLKRIDSLHTLDTTGKYTTLINNMNTLIGQYNTTVAHRATPPKPTGGEKPVV